MDAEFIAIIAEVLSGIVIFVTAWGLLPLDFWWVRDVDFPRLQILWLGAISLIAMIAVSFWQTVPVWHWLLLIGLVAALAFQLKMVLPYTRLWRQEVKSARQQAGHPRVRIMVSNVLTSNDNKQALIDLVAKQRPDILLTLETDKVWEDALSVIEPEFPFCVKVPLDNLYGMHLYSKLELIDSKVKFLIIDDIPSIHTQIKLANGKKVWLYCLHPMPPSPTEATKSTTRDAELLLVGRHIKKQNQIAILAGDLNDVAWSKTTRRFQRISGLLDPRIGRDFVNTFHAKYPFLRWALDHIFHSPCFTLVEIKRLPSIGSDHFPVMTVLQFEPESTVTQAQNAEQATADDLCQAENKICAGQEEGASVSCEHQQENAEK